MIPARKGRVDCGVRGKDAVEPERLWRQRAAAVGRSRRRQAVIVTPAGAGAGAVVGDGAFIERPRRAAGTVGRGTYILRVLVRPRLQKCQKS